MLHDKKQSLNEFLDKLSQGGMKGIWNYFNIYKKKKRRNTIQLEATQADHFKQYWGLLYTENQNKSKFLSIKNQLLHSAPAEQTDIQVAWEDVQQIISSIDLNKAAWGRITPLVIKWGEEVCLSQVYQII